MWKGILQAFLKFLPWIATAVGSAVGVVVDKQGIHVNWRRVLLWSILAPSIAIIGGRLVAVFSDCVTMFRTWSGEAETFPLGFTPRAIGSILHAYTSAGAFSSAVNLVYHLYLFFCVDRMLALSLQILAFHVFLKNSERFFSGITAVVHTAISVMSK